jgi:2-C-methyl-D-erythritol 4-phosphate cytidylyltransferase/2-C-methyl-D-erythritol 2,4-cyclodiphosphate synthase
MGRTVALVVAAGSGSRAGGEAPKQYRPLAGRPLLAHAVDRLSHPAIDAVRVVIGEGQEAAYREAIGERTLPSPILGGATRRESVVNGLEALAAEGDVERVLIHDAARPFLPAAVIDRLLRSLDTNEGAVPTLPVVDTLAKADGAGPGGEATDDAQVARAAGLSVALVEGDPALEKLTYEADFRRAEAALLVPRVGSGFDVHAFAPDRQLWLGGVEIPHAKGLAGHSDADVVLHALTDAILGALGAGDIGDHFPPSDPQWRGAPSGLFLEHARGLVEQAGGRIAHADVTIICEAPRIGPHRDAMRTRIAALLRVPAARISIKATTTERLGFTGRGEGIAAQAVATIMTGDDPC